MTCSSIILTILRFFSGVLSNFPPPLRVNSRYLISDTDEYDHDMTRVPEDSIYVEEYNADGETRRRVLYEGDEITMYTDDPFRQAKKPWIWIGDKTTEIELTDALAKYIVPGNTIQLDLILKLIKVNRETEIIYIDPRTLEEVPFPDSGVRIDAYEHA